MTKEITKAFILQEIRDKFKLREWELERFLFSETVIPTYDIGEHLKKWEVVKKIVSITSANNFIFFTVPQTERWTLRGYMLIFYSVGAYQVSGLYVTNRPLNTDYIYLDLKANQAGSYLVNLPIPVVLQPNNVVRVLVDNYVSTANLEVLMDVQREEIR